MQKIITNEQLVDPIQFRKLTPGFVNQRIFRGRKEAWSARACALRVGKDPASMFAFFAHDPRNLEKLSADDEIEGSRLCQHYEDATTDILDPPKPSGPDPKAEGGLCSLERFFREEFGEEYFDLPEFARREKRESRANEWTKFMAPPAQKRCHQVDKMKAEGKLGFGMGSFDRDPPPTNDGLLRRLRKMKREKSEEESA